MTQLMRYKKVAAGISEPGAPKVFGQSTHLGNGHYEFSVTASLYNLGFHNIGLLYHLNI